jgi:hypothetical protein
VREPEHPATSALPVVWPSKYEVVCRVAANSTFPNLLRKAPIGGDRGS